MQTRLWKLGIGLLVLLVTAISTAKIMGPKTDLIGMPGSDLVPSYMAGDFVRTGHVDWLMNFPRQSAYQHQLRLDEHLGPRRAGPWLNPPFYAWVFVPLSVLPFREAVAVWFGLNLLMTAAAVTLLATMVPRGTSWKVWGLIGLLLVCSFPYLQVIASEQNGCLSLLLLCATVACWRSERGFAAGAIAGLLLFKPQLAAVLIAAMCVCLGWRAILGVATTAMALLAVTMLTMHGALYDYLTKLPAMLPWTSIGGTFLWERQITWLGFWRLLFQHHAAGPTPLLVRMLWPIGAIAMAAVLGYAVIRARRIGEASSDRLIAAVIGAMPVVMPYYMDYDLMLLAVPAVLLAAEAIREGGLDAIGKWLIWGWMALYLWLFVNAGVADATRFNVLVPALAVMAVAQCIRALRSESVEFVTASPDSPMVAHFRASLPAAERAA
jgi:hypothetical protein